MGIFAVCGVKSKGILKVCGVLKNTNARHVTLRINRSYMAYHSVTLMVVSQYKRGILQTARYVKKATSSLPTSVPMY